jgi:hypothetical protein
MDNVKESLLMICKTERAFSEYLSIYFVTVSTNTGLSLDMNLSRRHVFRNIIDTHSETAVSNINGV